MKETIKIKNKAKEFGKDSLVETATPEIFTTAGLEDSKSEISALETFGCKKEDEREKEKFFSAKRLSKLGIFAALSLGLYFLNIPLAFLFPSFLKLNVSDLPALIGGFALGPLSGAIIVIVKILIKLPFSDSMCVGELSDLINGLAFILPATLIYKKNKNKKSAIIGILIGAACSVVTSMFSNRFLIIPFYVKVMGISFETLVGMCSAALPFITTENFYVVYIFVAVLPFNVIRCLIVGGVTFLTYKKISNLLHKM